VNSVADLKAAIRAELKADGCTQKDLAWYLGISEKHVSQVLTGKVTGHLGLLEAMAAAVGLSVGIVRDGAA
jgi:transcriptional regulator with XRE-family HTH domain